MKGHAWLAVVALLAVVPGGLAQSTLPDHAVLEAHVQLDHDDMETVDWTEEADSSLPEAGSPCRRSPDATAGGSPEPYIVALPDGTAGFRFTEGNAENGCAEARFAIDVPSGPGWAQEPSELLIAFEANRKVDQFSTTSAPRAIQEVRVYRAGSMGGCLDVGPPVAWYEYFPPEATTERQLRAFTWPVDLEALSPAGRPSDLCIGWYFGDQSRTDDAASLGINQGQTYSATVAEPRLEFIGGTVAIDAQHEDGVSPDGDLVGFVAVEIDVAGVRGDYGLSALLTLSDEHSLHAVEAWNGTGFEELPDRLARVQEQEGSLHVTLTAQALGGPNDRFRLTFRAPDTTTLQPAQFLAAAPILLLPIVVGVIAHRTVGAAQDRAHGRRRTRLLMIQATLLVSWAAFAAVVLYLLFTGSSVVLMAWPLAPVALFAYLVAMAVTATQIVVIVLARRLERTLMREDLTERERMQAELERSNRELSQFAYVASHDLKEPLRMVAGYTELLDRRYSDRLDPKGRRFLGFATEGAERMQQMIDDLLAYSRVRPSAAEPKDVDLESVVGLVKSQLRALIEERGARIRTETLPVVRGDRTQLVQLFQNLIHNGLKFNDRKRPEITVAAEPHGDMWQIAVRDNGVGIPAAQQDRIFQIFQRLHSRDKYDGNGIGLALCQKIVEQSGGRIWVQSEEGKGATFLFTLPGPGKSQDERNEATKVPRADRRGQRRGRGASVPRPG